MKWFRIYEIVLVAAAIFLLASGLLVTLFSWFEVHFGGWAFPLVFAVAALPCIIAEIQDGRRRTSK
jgi:hypothetical protein